MFSKTKTMMLGAMLSTLTACGGVEGLDFAAGEALQALETACGTDGRTVYETSCDDLQASCAGTFTCMDETPSRDGSCQTWGLCEELVTTDEVATDGDETAAKEKGAASVTYGPVITVKPKG